MARACVITPNAVAAGKIAASTPSCLKPRRNELFHLVFLLIGETLIAE
jgi:hypothetical protein